MQVAVPPGDLAANQETSLPGNLLHIHESDWNRITVALGNSRNWFLDEEGSPEKKAVSRRRWTAARGIPRWRTTSDHLRITAKIRRSPESVCQVLERAPPGRLPFPPSSPVRILFHQRKRNYGKKFGFFEKFQITLSLALNAEIDFPLIILLLILMRGWLRSVTDGDGLSRGGMPGPSIVSCRNSRPPSNSPFRYDGQ